jgi:hypothetical protein
MSHDPLLFHLYMSLLEEPTSAIPVPCSDDWRTHVEHISVPGRVVEITADQFDYWLSVLPPRWMRGSHYCFAEGAEPFRLFWRDRESRHYFCRQLTWDESVRFCRLAGIEFLG